MLSYDSPVSNGQNSTSAHAMSQAPKSASSLKMGVHNAVNGVSQNGQPGQHHHIWLVTGPAGCGKSTVAEYLAKSRDMVYLEGDEYHTAANVEKMRNGTPLTDADRWDWLTLLREEATRRISQNSNGVVVTCSALKRKYRDVIRVAAYYDPSILIHFIYLDAEEETLLKRVGERKGHYMGANMVHSQFHDLERPSADEKDVISVDVSQTIEEVKKAALARLTEVMGGEQNA
ncbi:gluconokinase-like protein [Paramyrothecium foliicola]|nr:gluconokinase-like protein [Paramyrothecium foliicola]